MHHPQYGSFAKVLCEGRSCVTSGEGVEGQTTECFSKTVVPGKTSMGADVGADGGGGMVPGGVPDAVQV